MEDKFKYILELQEQGLTRHEIKDKLGYKNLDSLTRFLKKRGYSFNDKLNKYIPVDDNSMTPVIKEITSKKQDIRLCDDKCIAIDIQQDIKNNILNLANDYEKIQEVLKWFKNRSDDNEVVNEGIKINLPKAKVKRTTIRINEITWNNFKKFAENHKEFNKQDLMAQALEEYMNKHK